MRFEAVLFDYNGTLIFDGDINDWAWRQTINELSQEKLVFDEVYERFKGQRNEIFLENVFRELGLPLDKAEIHRWAVHKETAYYHSFSRRHQRNRLCPGAVELLDYLKENKIPFNLCTASLKENIDFYFDYVGLKKWFDIGKVAYDEGIFQNKTDMYRTCAQRINTDIAECLVIEDSPNSITEARAAGCRNFVAIRREDTPDIPEILQVITDFTEFNYDLLK